MWMKPLRQRYRFTLQFSESRTKDFAVCFGGRAPGNSQTQLVIDTHQPTIEGPIMECAEGKSIPWVCPQFDACSPRDDVTC